MKVPRLVRTLVGSLSPSSRKVVRCEVIRGKAPVPVRALKRSISGSLIVIWLQVHFHFLGVVAHLRLVATWDPQGYSQQPHPKLEEHHHGHTLEGWECVGAFVGPLVLEEGNVMLRTPLGGKTQTLSISQGRWWI